MQSTAVASAAITEALTLSTYKPYVCVLMLYREIIAVCSEMHTKHINTETAAVPCIGWVIVIIICWVVRI